MTLEELQAARRRGEYVYHHQSLSWGYQSCLKDSDPVPYKGKFGEGYIVYKHNARSTRYCYKCYYIRKGESSNV